MSAFDAHDLIALQRVTQVVPSPDGTWLAVAVERLDAEDRASYVSDLWRVPLDDDAAPTRLTRGKHKDTSPCFRHDGALGFLSNRPVSEGDDDDDSRSQVWILPPHAGEPRPLTDEPLGVSDFAFARRGDRLVTVSPVLPDVPHDAQRETARDRKKHGPSALRYRRMPVRFWDRWLPDAAPHIVAFDAEGRDRTDLTPDADREHRNAHFDVSADGRYVALCHLQPHPDDRLNDWRLALHDLETDTTRFLGREPRTSYMSPVFSPDGSKLVCERHVRREGELGPTVLWLFDVESATGHAVLDEKSDYRDTWHVPHAWADDGRRVVTTADWRGHTPVFTVDTKSGEVARVTAADGDRGGQHLSIATLSGRAAVVGVRHRLDAPPAPFHVALGGRPAEPRIVADLARAGDDEIADLPAVEITSFEVDGANGDPVQSWLLQPADADDDGGLPTLVWIHGGPVSQWGDGWHWRWNPLVAVAQGYAVALPNPRGSTGCGQDFVEGVWNNEWGGDCYDDLVAVFDALEARDDVDGERMVAMGGSFGGYMTNWIGGHTDRFACLVSHAGIFHMSAFYGVTDVPAWWLFGAGSTPFGELESQVSDFHRYSPHRFVHNWTTPVLIIHGEKDYRVPIGEALALFEWLQAHDVESELLAFPDENHWILKPRNVVAWYEAVIEFIDRHVA